MVSSCPEAASRRGRGPTGPTCGCYPECSSKPHASPKLPPQDSNLAPTLRGLRGSLYPTELGGITCLVSPRCHDWGSPSFTKVSLHRHDVLRRSCLVFPRSQRFFAPRFFALYRRHRFTSAPRGIGRARTADRPAPVRPTAPAALPTELRSQAREVLRSLSTVMEDRHTHARSTPRLPTASLTWGFSELSDRVHTVPP